MRIPLLMLILSKKKNLICSYLKKSASILRQTPLHQQKLKKKQTKQQLKNVTAKFDFTTIEVRLRTACGGVTTATKPVWINWFTRSKPSHQPKEMHNQYDTHLKKAQIIILIIDREPPANQSWEVIQSSAIILGDTDSTCISQISSDIRQNWFTPLLVTKSE